MNENRITSSTESTSTESPVRHTQGGEMPDTRTSSEMLRRVEANASLLGNGRGAIILGALAILGLGVWGGIYFYSRRTERSRLDDLRAA